jgi:exodeoxyribonuclease VII large subunit
VADVRASTPTDAAKLVVPDVAQEVHGVGQARVRMRQALTGLVSREQAGLDALRSRPVLADPRVLLDARSDELVLLRDRSRRCVRHALDRAHDDIGHQRARARALSPLATLERGYSVLQDADGHVLTSVEGVAAGARVSVRVVDGRVHADVSSTEQIDQREADA